MYERLFSLKLPFRSIRKPTDHSRHDSHRISVLYLNTTTVPKDFVRPLRVLKMGNFEMLTISATTRKISALALLPLWYQRTSHIHYRCEDIKWIDMPYGTTIDIFIIAYLPVKNKVAQRATGISLLAF